MNSNRRVLFFVVYSIGLLLLFSIVAYISGFNWTPFSRVNLITDIVHSREDSIVITDSSLVITTPVDTLAGDKEFSLYHQGGSIINFHPDTQRTRLPHVAKKLYALKEGKPAKVRIAYFGDSMIEGDLLTQTLRELLQKYFGGNGVGFVPITSPVAKFRQTVRVSYDNNWNDESFKTGKTSRLYLSGHSFSSAGGWVQMIDQTSYDSTAIVEKSLLYGYAPTPATINVNGSRVTLPGKNPVNRTVLINDAGRAIRMAVSNPALPVYGISFESASGVFVDNFSFRGISGVEFARVDSSFIAAVAAENPYDLIIFQYGVNLLFRPNDKNFNWYAKAMLPIVRKLKGAFSSSDFVLVSTADRAFRYGGEYQSAVGIDSLIKVQALLAYEAGTSFYNQYETMGGKNSIVDWVKQKPSLANQDYIHPNHRGAAKLATYFYEAILKEYEKYSNNVKK